MLPRPQRVLWAEHKPLSVQQEQRVTGGTRTLDRR